MTELRHNNDGSIHERIQSIYDEENADRKAEIADKIRFGDSLTKIVLSIAFRGFWIFWLLVTLF